MAPAGVAVRRSAPGDRLVAKKRVPLPFTASARGPLSAALVPTASHVVPVPLPIKFAYRHATATAALTGSAASPVALHAPGQTHAVGGAAPPGQKDPAGQGAPPGPPVQPAGHPLPGAAAQGPPQVAAA